MSGTDHRKFHFKSPVKPLERSRRGGSSDSNRRRWRETDSRSKSTDDHERPVSQSSGSHDSRQYSDKSATARASRDRSPSQESVQSRSSRHSVRDRSSRSHRSHGRDSDSRSVHDKVSSDFHEEDVVEIFAEDEPFDDIASRYSLRRDSNEDHIDKKDKYEEFDGNLDNFQVLSSCDDESHADDVNETSRRNRRNEDSEPASRQRMEKHGYQHNRGDDRKRSSAHRYAAVKQRQDSAHSSPVVIRSPHRDSVERRNSPAGELSRNRSEGEVRDEQWVSDKSFDRRRNFRDDGTEGNTRHRSRYYQGQRNNNDEFGQHHRMDDGRFHTSYRDNDRSHGRGRRSYGRHGHHREQHSDVGRDRGHELEQQHTRTEYYDKSKRDSSRGDYLDRRDGGRAAYRKDYPTAEHSQDDRFHHEYSNQPDQVSDRGPPLSAQQTESVQNRRDEYRVDKDQYNRESRSQDRFSDHRSSRSQEQRDVPFPSGYGHTENSTPRGDGANSYRQRNTYNRNMKSQSLQHYERFKKKYYRGGFVRNKFHRQNDNKTFRGNDLRQHRSRDNFENMRDTENDPNVVQQTDNDFPENDMQLEKDFPEDNLQVVDAVGEVDENFLGTSDRDGSDRGGGKQHNITHVIDVGRTGCVLKEDRPFEEREREGFDIKWDSDKPIPPGYYNVQVGDGESQQQVLYIPNAEMDNDHAAGPSEGTVQGIVPPQLPSDLQIRPETIPHVSVQMEMPDGHREVVLVPVINNPAFPGLADQQFVPQQQIQMQPIVDFNPGPIQQLSGTDRMNEESANDEKPLAKKVTKKALLQKKRLAMKKMEANVEKKVLRKLALQSKTVAAKTDEANVREVETGKSLTTARKNTSKQPVKKEDYEMVSDEEPQYEAVSDEETGGYIMVSEDEDQPAPKKITPKTRQSGKNVVSGEQLRDSKIKTPVAAKKKSEVQYDSVSEDEDKGNYSDVSSDEETAFKEQGASPSKKGRISRIDITEKPALATEQQKKAKPQFSPIRGPSSDSKTVSKIVTADKRPQFIKKGTKRALSPLRITVDNDRFGKTVVKGSDGNASVSLEHSKDTPKERMAVQMTQHSKPVRNVSATDTTGTLSLGTDPKVGVSKELDRKDIHPTTTGGQRFNRPLDNVDPCGFGKSGGAQQQFDGRKVRPSAQSDFMDHPERQGSGSPSGVMRDRLYHERSSSHDRNQSPPWKVQEKLRRSNVESSYDGRNQSPPRDVRDNSRRRNVNRSSSRDRNQTPPWVSDTKHLNRRSLSLERQEGPANDFHSFNPRSDNQSMNTNSQGNTFDGNQRKNIHPSYTPGATYDNTYAAVQHQGTVSLSPMTSQTHTLTPGQQPDFRHSAQPNMGVLNSNQQMNQRPPFVPGNAMMNTGHMNSSMASSGAPTMSQQPMSQLPYPPASVAPGYNQVPPVNNMGQPPYPVESTGYQQMGGQMVGSQQMASNNQGMGMVASQQQMVPNFGGQPQGQMGNQQFYGAGTQMPNVPSQQFVNQPGQSMTQQSTTQYGSQVMGQQQQPMYGSGGQQVSAQMGNVQNVQGMGSQQQVMGVGGSQQQPGMGAGSQPQVGGYQGNYSSASNVAGFNQAQQNTPGYQVVGMGSSQQFGNPSGYMQNSSNVVGQVKLPSGQTGYLQPLRAAPVSEGQASVRSQNLSHTAVSSQSSRSHLVQIPTSSTFKGNSRNLHTVPLRGGRGQQHRQAPSRAPASYQKGPVKYGSSQHENVDGQEMVSDDDSDDQDRVFKCVKCKKEFSNEKTMKKHSRWHEHFAMGKKDTRCDECQLAFIAVIALSKHISDVHLAKSYTCETCGLSFNSQSLLSKHLKSGSHYIKNPHTCTLCNSGFASNAQLSRHRKQKHPEGLMYSAYTLSHM